MTTSVDVVAARFHNQLPQALLLLGIEGVGKFTAAEMLLRARAASSDILLLEEPRVGVVRELSRWAGLRPFSSSIKGAVLRADRATEEALNALLKLLEEPPPYFHLIITAAKRPPLTIVSRCLRFVCPPLQAQDIIDILVEQQGLPDQAAREVAELAAGSLGKALRIAEHADERTQILSYLGLVSVIDWVGIVNSTRQWSPVHIECLVDELLRRLAEPGDFAQVQRLNVERALNILSMPMKSSLKGMVVARTLTR